MWKRVILLGLAGSLVLAVLLTATLVMAVSSEASAGGPLDEIHTGMTVQEVCAILGTNMQTARRSDGKTAGYVFQLPDESSVIVFVDTQQRVIAKEYLRGGPGLLTTLSDLLGL